MTAAEEVSCLIVQHLRLIRHCHIVVKMEFMGLRLFYSSLNLDQKVEQESWLLVFYEVSYRALYFEFLWCLNLIK